MATNLDPYDPINLIQSGIDIRKYFPDTDPRKNNPNYVYITKPIHTISNISNVYNNLPIVLKTDIITDRQTDSSSDPITYLVNELKQTVELNFSGPYGYKSWSTNPNTSFLYPTGYIFGQSDYYRYILKNAHIKRACSLGRAPDSQTFNTFVNGLTLKDGTKIPPKINYIPSDAEPNDYYTVDIRLPYNGDNIQNEGQFRVQTMVYGASTKENIIEYKMLVPKLACYNLDGDGFNYLNYRNDTTLIPMSRFGRNSLLASANKPYSVNGHYYAYNETDDADIKKVNIFMRTFCKLMKFLYIQTGSYGLNYGDYQECACINNQLYDAGGGAFSPLGEEGIVLLPSDNCSYAPGNSRPSDNQFITEEQYKNANTQISATICNQNINMSNITAGGNFAMTKSTLVQACGNSNPDVGKAIAAALDSFTSELTNQTIALDNVYNLVTSNVSAAYVLTNNIQGNINAAYSQYNSIVDKLNNYTNLTSSDIYNLYDLNDRLYNINLQNINNYNNNINGIGTILGNLTQSQNTIMGSIQDKFKTFFQYYQALSLQYYNTTSGTKCSGLTVLTNDLYNQLRAGNDVGQSICIDAEANKDDLKKYYPTRQDYVNAVIENSTITILQGSFTKLLTDMAIRRTSTTEINTYKDYIYNSILMIDYNSKNIDLNNTINFINIDNLNYIDSSVIINSGLLTNLQSQITKYTGSDFATLSGIYTQYQQIYSTLSSTYVNPNPIWRNNIKTLTPTTDSNYGNGFYDVLSTDRDLVNNKFNMYSSIHLSLFNTLKRMNINTSGLLTIYNNNLQAYNQTLQTITNLLTSTQNQMDNTNILLDMITNRTISFASSVDRYYNTNYIIPITNETANLINDLTAFTRAKTVYMTNKSADIVSTYNSTLLAVKNRVNNYYSNVNSVVIKQLIDKKPIIGYSIITGMLSYCYYLQLDIANTLNLINTIKNHKLIRDSNFTSSQLEAAYDNINNTYLNTIQYFIDNVTSSQITEAMGLQLLNNVPTPVSIQPPQPVKELPASGQPININIVVQTPPVPEPTQVAATVVTPAQVASSNASGPSGASGQVLNTTNIPIAVTPVSVPNVITPQVIPASTVAPVKVEETGLSTGAKIAIGVGIATVLGGIGYFVLSSKPANTVAKVIGGK